MAQPLKTIHATCPHDCPDTCSMLVTVKDGKEVIESDPNPAGAFLLYAGIAVIGIFWGIKYIPETKGVTLEKIEEHWRQGKAPNEL